MVDGSHPLGVALGQVVVDGDEVSALALEGVEVEGQGGDQGLPLPGLHLGYPALVQDESPKKLDVEVPHASRPDAGLAHDRERLRQESIQGLASVDPAQKLLGLVA